MKAVQLAKFIVVWLFALTATVMLSHNASGHEESSGEADSYQGACKCCLDCEPWVVSRAPICDTTQFDWLSNHANIEGRCFKFPVTGGAWHWFHQSLIGRGGGYGIPGIRDTYFWYLYGDPVYDLGDGRKVGGHAELRLRETDSFRSFIDDQVWFWEAYGYIEHEELGKLKAGQVFKQFGLFWDGVFFGNAPYFDGMKLDADYGLSWEKTTEVDDCFSVASFVQFFFHEDQSNGSFPGGDAESVVDYTERNTGVVRLVPTWKRSDGSVIEFGLSGLVGEIDSRTPTLRDQTVFAYAVDVTYTKGPWKLFAEGAQTFGIINPRRYVSGGPSNRITNVLAGVHYTRGPITYRCSYSNSIDDNPRAIQNMVLAGMTVAVTKSIDFYLEYVSERVDGADDPSRNGYFFHGLEWVVNWRF